MLFQLFYFTALLGMEPRLELVQGHLKLSHFPRSALFTSQQNFVRLLSLVKCKSSANP